MWVVVGKCRSGVMGDRGYGCVPHEGIWCDGGSCRRVSGVMSTFRWLS